MGKGLEAEDDRAGRGQFAGGTCVLENNSGPACQLRYRKLLRLQSGEERARSCWFGKSGSVFGTGHAGMLMLADAPGWR